MIRETPWPPTKAHKDQLPETAKLPPLVLLIEGGGQEWVGFLPDEPVKQWPAIEPPSVWFKNPWDFRVACQTKDLHLPVAGPMATP